MNANNANNNDSTKFLAPMMMQTSQILTTELSVSDNQNGTNNDSWTNKDGAMKNLNYGAIDRSNATPYISQV